MTRVAGNLFALALLLTLLAVGCSATHPRQDPVGEIFPVVRGNSLDDREVRIPRDFAGTETLLLIGYEMDSQFDIDRWLLGLNQAGVVVPTYELPTIRGMVPGLISGVINNGMRSGIPSEDWAIVLTIYQDADVVAAFLGNEIPLPARVVLLDQSGRVVFFHDRGYSTRSLLQLKNELEQIRSGRK